MLSNYYLDVSIKAEQMRDELREAETRRMLRQAGINRPGWLSGQVCRLLRGLGGMLVALGRRLPDHATPTVVPSAEFRRIAGTSASR